MIAERNGISRHGLEQLRERFVEEGFETTLNSKGKGRRPRSIQGQNEPRLIALVCGPKPEGRSRWTLSLLAEEWSVLANTDVKKASQETIRQTLIKNELKPWRSAEWYIPPGGNGEFVAAKEDVVDVYTREEEEKRPLGCMDECPKQLIGEVRTPLPAGAGTMVK